MKVIITSLLLAICFAGKAHAQTPLYKFSSYSGSGNTTGWSFNWRDARVQSIYFPSNFPSMPAGIVKNVYIRTSYTFCTTSTETYHNLIVKLGNTSDSTFSNNGWQPFKTNLTTVYSAAAHVFSGADTPNKWMKIPCTGNFAYNPTSKFIMEISHKYDTATSFQGFNLMGSNVTAPNYRSMANRTDSLGSTNAGSFALDLGFDLATADVAGLGNVSSIGLFPNPSSDGKFNISFDAKHAVHLLEVCLTNVTGQIIWKHSYQVNNSSSFQEIVPGTLAKGSYFVRCSFDGEVYVRRVILQ